MIILRKNQKEPIKEAIEYFRSDKPKPFGKYKDQPLTAIPKHYLKWMLENFNWDSKNAKLRNSIMCVIG